MGEIAVIIFKKWDTQKLTSSREVLTDQSGKTGVYFDEKGQPMLGSALSRDPKFQQLVVAETKALLKRV